MSAKEMVALRTESINSFNSDLRWFVNVLAKKFPTDQKVLQTQRQAKLAFDMLPLAVIDAVGPRLLEHQDAIYKGEADFFLAKTYEDETEGGGAAAETARHIIPLVKQAWRESDSAAQKLYHERVVSMLDAFIDYATTLVGDHPEN